MKLMVVIQLMLLIFLVVVGVNYLPVVSSRPTLVILKTIYSQILTAVVGFYLLIFYCTTDVNWIMFSVILIFIANFCNLIL